MKTALVLSWAYGVFTVLHKIWISASTGWIGWDAHAYWLAARGDMAYSRSGGEVDAYLYSPAFATVIHPIATLDWSLFYSFWVVLQSSALIWLLKPLKLRWAVPFFLASVPELINGNIFILLAMCAVLGLTRPAWYSVALLTKVTPGVGLLWFAGKRDWRSLSAVAMATLLVTACSYVLTPTEWNAWLHFLLSHHDGSPDGLAGLAVRFLLAAALVLYGAKKDMAWLIAPAMVIASPIFDFPVLTLLTAIPRLASGSGSKIIRNDQVGTAAT
ncbi:glycosyltransferase family 87 protein [Pseudarthrobacter sp902506025]|uniref:glycosyltransferase family 87 protein n=1 Tax=Pseudarthrobacter sp. 902506025 TaxID=3155291 RepID=UPI00344D0A71